MKHVLLSLVLVILFFGGYAKKVDVETAKNAAKNAYYQRVNQLSTKSINDINLSLVYTEQVNNVPIYYVFNVNENEGFIIISADDIAKPVIGYSFEGPYPVFNQAPTFSEWMNDFKVQISYGIQNNLKASSTTNNEWSELLKKNPSIKKVKSAQPLLIHTWNQDNPYNELCPVDAAGPGGHVYAGCVAVSMAQVMKFYNYPVHGTGSHTDYSYWNGGYGNLTVNYADQTYIWENMPNNVNSSTNGEVAKLLYHCSVAVDMNYSPTGSGSQTSKIATALKTYYYYSTNIQTVSKDNYSEAAWESLLQQQIDNNWPMCYAGMTSSSEGHAWNCDGYIGSEFHMNWGWSGSANGYYTLDSLIAGGYDFTSTHQAVINIYPASNYPTWCSGQKSITGVAGTFEDGSGNQNYLNNQDCLYLIQPSCASIVTLSFDRFDLGSGDHVYVYDGATINDPLLADFTSSNVPTSSVIGNNGALLIRFVSDASGNNYGWNASYTTSTCTGTKTLAAVSGTITDGSQSCNYENSKICTWNVQPAFATSFQVQFPEFDLAAGDAGDMVKIYKNNTATSNLIGSYTSSNLPPATIDIPGASKLIVKFNSNSSLNAGGWTLNYNATLSNIENITSTYEIGIFPNPYQHDATIKYTLTGLENNVNIRVQNIMGQMVGEYKTSQTQGQYIIPMSSFTNNLSQGMYFVTININDNEATFKLIHE
jgi:hypothetical protein